MHEHESEIPSRLFDPHLLRRMLHFARPYVRHMLAALALIVPLAFLTNLLPLLVRNAIDRYLAPAAASLAAGDRLPGLSRLGGLYLLIAAGGMVLRFGQGYLLTWVGQRIIFDMRADIFSKILRLPHRYFDRNPVGRLMTRVSYDVEAMQRLLTDGMIGLSTDVVTVIAILGFMFYLSPRLALILLVLFPFLFASLIFLNRKVRLAHRQVRQRQSSLNAYLQEAITGMLTIQLFNREAYAVGRFEQLNRSLRGALLEAIKWFSYSFPATEIQNAATVALILLAGGLMILGGDHGVTLGVLVAFLAYVRDFFRPLDDLSEKSNVLQSAMASAERVFGLMDEPEEILDPENPAEVAAFRGDVRFQDVQFAYNDEDWVLRDIDLHIRPGESVAIVGATGAGKSSVISLIARFYDVQRGTVLVDGIDVRRYRQAELRSRIGIVLQDPFLFSGTIATNISLHNPAVTRDGIAEAARFVNAHAFIERIPGGYDAPVLERGAGLSTGQKQLLALARAIAQNPDILLILDEATANVDTETEILIQDALKKLMRGRTSILIAHRLSTIRHADRILVMRQGRIEEEGSHADLLRQDGYYKRLYDLLSHATPRNHGVAD
jgi:ATP-binding cassette, subfamily B, multidrug efflux pump